VDGFMEDGKVEHGVADISDDDDDVVEDEIGGSEELLTE